MNMDNRWPKLGLLISAATLFGALLYFVGRRYTDAYFSTVGIPSNLLRFEVADYMYQGAHPIEMLIALGFTVLGIGLLRFVTRQNNAAESKPYTRMTTIFIVGYFVYFVFMLVILALLDIFGVRDVALTLAALVSSLFAAGWGIMMFFDQNLLSRVKRSRRLSRLLVLGGALSVFLFPYLGAGAWGAYMGTYDTSPQRISQVFQTIVLTAKQPIIEELAWESQDEGIFQTKDRLYLLLSNNGRLFIRAEGWDDKLFVIYSDTLYSFTLDTSSNEEDIGAE